MARNKDERKKGEDGKESVQSLLKRLEGAEDQAEKRKLRMKLRAAGHVGGLREDRSEAMAKARSRKLKDAKSDKVKAKSKKRAKVEADDEDDD